MPQWVSITITVPAPDVEAGRRFYAELFGREPDLIPAPAVYEWELREGTWLQVTQGIPGPGQTLRLGVDDLEATLDLFTALGGTPGERIEIPGLILIQDVSDPFGNRLSLYEEWGGQP